MIENAIVDKNCRIGPGVKIAKPGDNHEGPINDVCDVRDGILVVEKDACLPAGWQL
jgi:glucose-1-phosphate adenylyltransferase